jgi:CheY-like chemotaxis protein
MGFPGVRALDQKVAKKNWILLVEDDNTLRGAIRDKINQARPDCRVVECADGSEARHRLDNQAFQCVITDINMPKLGGQGVIKYARSSKMNATTPLIIITGNPDASLTKGHDHVLMIAKPFRPDDFIRTLDEQLKLGSTEDRIPIDLLNIVLSSAVHWAGSLNLQPKPGAPQPRASLKDLRGDSYVFLRFNYKSSKPWVGVGVSPEFAKKVSAAAAGEAIWRTFQEQIFKDSSEKAIELIDRMIAGRLEIANPDSQNYRGVTIPVETASGVLFIEGFVSGATIKRLKAG